MKLPMRAFTKEIMNYLTKIGVGAASCCCLSACGGAFRGDVRFTEADIASLHLDSTQVLPAVDSAVVRVNLNPFLGNREFDFGSLVNSMRLIPLETNDNSLVANIYKVLLTDKYIYIHDDFKRGGLIIFTADGKFVRRISHGGGPGELYRLSDIDFDRENQYLLAYQHPYLMYYTPDGQYLRQKKLPFGFYNFCAIPGGYAFKTMDGYGNEHLGTKKDYTLLVTDTTFRLKQAALPSPRLVGFGGYHYLYKTSEVQVTAKFCDTVYTYKPLRGELEATYALDYSDKKLPYSYCLDTNSNKFMDAITQNDYYYFVGEYLENNTHQVFFLRNDYRNQRTVIYRDKRTGEMTGGSNANFDKNVIPPIAFPTAVYGDCFVSLHYPNPNDSCLQASPLLSAEEKRALLQLQEDDNPVLVSFALKTIKDDE